MIATTQPALPDRGLILRQPQHGDGPALHSLVAACPPLDLNSRYAYLLQCEHHAQTSVVAYAGDVLAGAITAYVLPAQPDTLFVWQVAVAQALRGQGLARQMLGHLLEHCITPQRLRWLETTISPGNLASHQLFTNFALRHDAGCSITTVFSAEAFGESGHEEERLYKIGPWTAQAA